MRAAVESGDVETAQSLSRDLVKSLSGSTSDNTIQLYRFVTKHFLVFYNPSLLSAPLHLPPREILSLTIGAQVKSDLLCFTKNLHRTWLFMCYGFTAGLYTTDSIKEYKLFSTRLAVVNPASAQLNALRYAISTEATTQGAQILWTRQVPF